MWEFFRKRRKALPNDAGGANGTNFRHTDPIEIGRMMAELARRNVTGNLEYTGGCFATRVLSVDASARTFAFDQSRDAACNAAVLRSSQCRFSAALAGIPVEFTIAGASERHLDTTPVFEAALPNALLHMQRRAAFRVRTPVAEPFFCSGRLLDGEPFHTNVFDLSVGGICCETSDRRLIELKKGVRLRDVELHLHDCSYPVDLQLASQTKVATSSGGFVHHIGFAFVSLPGDVESALQRIVLRLEFHDSLDAYTTRERVACAIDSGVG